MGEITTQTGATSGVQGAADKLFEINEHLKALEGEINQFGLRPTQDQVENVKKQLREMAEESSQLRMTLTGTATPPPPPQTRSTPETPPPPNAPGRQPGRQPSND